MPPINDPNTVATLRWLYVDFNSYFASVEQQLQPHLRGRPVAVIPVDTDSTSAIAASYEAKAFGVKTGTPVWEAKKMCPGLVCVVANHEKYVRYHQKILVEVDKHIPVTAVCSIDEVACKLMDNETSVERVTQIAMAIKKGLREHVGEFVKCSIGVAPNKYLAKVATDLEKPDGFTIIHGQELPGPLMGLKLTDLPGIGRNMEVRLRRAGVINMDVLWSLDAKHMRRVWGSIWGEKMWYYLRGVDLPDEETHRSSVGHSHVMAPELRMPVKARYVGRRLLLKAAARLRRMDYYTTCMSFSMRCENGLRYARGAQFYRVQDSLMLLQVFEALWVEAVGAAGNEPIKKVSVVLHGLVPAADAQPELLDVLPESGAKERKKAERVSRAMDKLNQKYGRDSVALGMLPAQGKNFSGTKVAFTRIPDVEEFFE